MAAFFSFDGKPVDKGTEFLVQLDIVPPLTDLTLGRGRVLTLPNGILLVALIVKERLSTRTDQQILTETLHSLLDIVTELNLNTLSISKSDMIDDIHWDNIITQIKNIFFEKAIVITICLNLTIVPPEDDRRQIIIENHTSPTGGHQGVTKTFRRIR